MTATADHDISKDVPVPVSGTANQNNQGGPSSAQRSVIKAILFDMDGTLLDTEYLSDKALLFAIFGRAAIPETVLSQFPCLSDYRLPWELKKQLLGLRGAEWAPIVIQYAEKHWKNDDNTVAFPDAMQLWKSWEDHLNDMCEEVEACDGAKELVRAIATQSNTTALLLPMAIATSSRYASVAKKRKRHETGMFEYIETIVAGDDPAVQNGKPAPDIYVEAAKRLGVNPRDCLVFEDALSGVKSGKAAGCKVVAIPDPRYSKEERETFADVGGADFVLNSLWEFDGRPFGINVNMAALR
jgi:HAD superfamily hydrolase (TIGR01509 family)